MRRHLGLRCSRYPPGRASLQTREVHRGHSLRGMQQHLGPRTALSSRLCLLPHARRPPKPLPQQCARRTAKRLTHRHGRLGSGGEEHTCTSLGDPVATPGSSTQASR
eukprot:2376834-Pyramimonas_sp.AAC.1